jgi:dihydroorotate dehydrogenase electron transfer subunit
LGIPKTQTQATVCKSEQLALNIYRITLEDKSISQFSHAGNFINIQIPQQGLVLWRRPFSIHSTNPHEHTFQILFSTSGRGTSILKDVKVGETLDIIGPLGNSFVLDSRLDEIIIVAGGLGIAPFKLLLEDAKPLNIKRTLFFGAGTASQFCCLDEFTELGAALELTTDDGTKGIKGLITVPLEEYLSSKTDSKNRELFVCGPTPMMQRVKELAEEYKIKAQVTVENVMACGFGACVGCPVPLAHPTDDGNLYKLACKDGPVFNMSEILLND